MADRHVVLPMPPIETRYGVPTFRSAIAVGRAFAAVLSFLLRVRPDVVRVHFLDYSLLYWVAFARAFRYRLVVTDHGSEINVLAGPGERSAAERLLLRLARRADVLTATARGVAGILGEATDRKVVTIANGVDTAFWGGERGGAARRGATIGLVSEPVKVSVNWHDVSASGSQPECGLLS